MLLRPLIPGRVNPADGVVYCNIVDSETVAKINGDRGPGTSPQSRMCTDVSNGWQDARPASTLS